MLLQTGITCFTKLIRNRLVDDAHNPVIIDFHTHASQKLFSQIYFANKRYNRIIFIRANKLSANLIYSETLISLHQQLIEFAPFHCHFLICCLSNQLRNYNRLDSLVLGQCVDLCFLS